MSPIKVFLVIVRWLDRVLLRLNVASDLRVFGLRFGHEEYYAYKSLFGSLYSSCPCYPT